MMIIFHPIKEVIIVPQTFADNRNKQEISEKCM